MAGSLVRGRVATCLVFLAFGTALGAWTARIPAIKHDLGLGDGQLSIGLLAFAAGAITGMQVVGRLVDRHRSTAVMVPAAIVEGVCLTFPALAVDVVSLAAALFAFGAVHGSLNIAMNAHAVEVQRAWGKPIMSSFHAVYSVGGFLGAAIGGLFAHSNLGPGVTFAAVGAGVAALALWAARWTLRLEAPRPTTNPGWNGTTAPGVVFLGILVFCCMVGEGAAADWSSVYLRESLGSAAGVAAAAYAAFSIMMVAGRLVGDRLAARLGPVNLVRGCGALAAAGLGIALLIGHPVAGVIGFGCLGAGLSCIAPQIFSHAGDRDPARAGQAIARVASVGYLGFLTGPLLIGAAAEAVGLPWALTIPAILAFFVTLTAAALRPRRVHAHA
ncbi:MFS transporter [Micromonospora sp. CPCC 206061]|uniref:MFS transporter n=1 Tax=Micromonospora sp. CPCC 206061 TaxID=3122410 RepID=UPI002FEEB946